MASQIINCTLIKIYKSTTDRTLIITLDSGATVSYIRLSKVLELGVPIGKNGQLAILADKKTRMASLGEIDTELVIDNIVVRLRALVMENLQATCYGGTTFHTDNSIEADINTGDISIHGKYVIKQSNPVRPILKYPPSTLVLVEPLGATTNLSKNSVRPRDPTLNIAAAQVVLPSESVSLKLPPELSDKSKIVVDPRFDNQSRRYWPPQVCDVVDGSAIYLNPSKTMSISHPKHAHFLTRPVTELRWKLQS